MIVFRHIAVIAGLLLVAAALANAQPVEMDGKTLLAKLREADAKALATITIDARIVRPHPALNELPDSERLVELVRVTRQNDTWAVESKTDPAMPPPTFHKPANPTDINRDGQLMVWRQQRERTFWEPDFLGSHRIDALYRVTPDRVPTSQPGGSLVQLNKPGPLAVGQLYIPILCSGRGYSLLIDQIQDVRTVQEGKLIQCLATGQFSGSGDQIWELLIEPDAGYLVRNAANKVAEFRNSGKQETGAGVFPQQAVFIFGSAQDPAREDRKWEITFTSIEAQADRTLIEASRALLRAAAYPNGTRVFDRSGGVTQSYTAGEARGSARRGASTTRPTTRP